MTTIWNADVANAVAHHLSMPGVEHHQKQYVRYQGQTSAAHTQHGWTLAASEAAVRKAEGMPDPFEDVETEAFVAPGSMPQQVQLSITTAPADFCLPMKKQKKFKPGFQVEVRVVHGGRVHLPVRVKAFLISGDQVNELDEWLPEELQAEGAPVDAKDSVESKLQGGRVLSCLFSNTAHASSHGHQHAAFAPLHVPGHRPVFPNRPPSAETSVEPTVKLASDASLISEATDPTDSASMLHVVSGTVLAEFDFATLKFAAPTTMRPVHIAFACLVANRDLLYTVYTVPCIAVCRAEQREAARQRLGLPASVWADLGISRPAVISKTPPRPGAAPKAEPAGDAAAAQGASPSMHEMWVTVADKFVMLPHARAAPAASAPPNAAAPPGTLHSQMPRPTQQPSLSEPPNLAAPNLLISSSTLDAMLRSGSANANSGGQPRPSNGSFESFWNFLQQQDPSASLEDLLQRPTPASAAAAAPSSGAAAAMRCSRAAVCQPMAAGAAPTPTAAAALNHAGLEWCIPVQPQRPGELGPPQRQRSRDHEAPMLDFARLR